jgi:hypothetical protein
VKTDMRGHIERSSIGAGAIPSDVAGVCTYPANQFAHILPCRRHSNRRQLIRYLKRSAAFTNQLRIAEPGKRAGFLKAFGYADERRLGAEIDINPRIFLPSDGSASATMRAADWQRKAYPGFQPRLVGSIGPVPSMLIW